MLVLMLLAMILLAVIQVLMRNTFGTGIVWSESFVRILVLWVAFLGAMIGSRNGEHICIELLSHYFPRRLYLPIQRTVSFISGLLSLLAAWVCMQFVLLEKVEQTIAFSDVPAWVCELILPFGFFVMAIRFVSNAISPPSNGIVAADNSLSAGESRV